VESPMGVTMISCDIGLAEKVHKIAHRTRDLKTAMIPGLK
jgi:hypothetical protein